MKNYTQLQLEKAISGSHGIVAGVAARLKCKWETADKYIRSYGLEKLLESEREKTLDLAESKLIQNIASNDNTAIIFFLKTQGKDRGYVERQEITGANGGALASDLTISTLSKEEKELLLKVARGIETN